MSDFGAVWLFDNWDVVCFSDACWSHSPSGSRKGFFFFLFLFALWNSDRIFGHIHFQPEKNGPRIYSLYLQWGEGLGQHSHSLSRSRELFSFILVAAFLLTDHLHQALRSARLRGRSLSEMRKEKIRPVWGEIKLCSCSVCLLTQTHTVMSGLTPPRRPTLPSPLLPPPSLPRQQ